MPCCLPPVFGSIHHTDTCSEEKLPPCEPCFRPLTLRSEARGRLGQGLKVEGALDRQRRGAGVELPRLHADDVHLGAAGGVQQLARVVESHLRARMHTH